MCVLDSPNPIFLTPSSLCYLKNSPAWQRNGTNVFDVKDFDSFSWLSDVIAGERLKTKNELSINYGYNGNEYEEERKIGSRKINVICH